MPLRTHICDLEESVKRYPSSAAFRFPQLPLADSLKESGTVSTNARIDRYTDITYVQFHADVERYASYWAHVLQSDNIPSRSVVGLWISGMTYTDVMHIYSIARASYIPQLFSLRLPNPDIIHELLTRSHARALILDPSYYATARSISLPVYAASTVSPESTRPAALPPLETLDPDDIAVIFHTSGSTSGSPKLVPCTFRWLDSSITKCAIVHRPIDPNKQDVHTWIGSACHIAQTLLLLGSVQHGSCIIQPSSIPFSTNELEAMICSAGLNRLVQFPSFLGKHLRASRDDCRLLDLLIGLDELLFCGSTLSADEEDWAFRNGMKLRSAFGSTECGPMLVSAIGAEDGISQRTGRMKMRAIEGTSYDFVPVTAPSTPVVLSTTDASTDENESEHERLVQLVVRSDSSDCPHPSLRAADGHFHTGDLFLPVLAADGSTAYISRGRDDDWIKTVNALRCDTKAIEENVRAMCSDLVSDCVVVGSGRPSPALFIESHVDADDEGQVNLRMEIIRRTSNFHARRYLHERITDERFIVVVAKGSLPRTVAKGNIRRKAVEEMYEELLDRLYNEP